MSFPQDLLEQARHLANREPKHPKEASLRRAVSTAYYALFHLLSTETAKNWKRAAERGKFARMLDHGAMSTACRTKRDELEKSFKASPQAGGQLAVGRHLHRITDTFVQMREHRNKADYDGDTKWTRTDVLSKIQSVEDAFDSWRQIRHEDEAQKFLITLLLKRR
ncbi:MAG: hypothetical protein LAP38_04610 [Acidobacteriia bacterium]|nr:hypothetical protein [Terriglobia bacterium]